MALTTKEIQTQRALMEQEIESLNAQLTEKQKDFEDAFGKIEFNKKKPASKFKVIMISCVIGIGLGLALIISLKKYYPDVVPF